MGRGTHSRGSAEKERRIKVLFLCTGNACRSTMAEGWARALKSDRIEAFSAGVSPCFVHPLAARVMQEAGVDISAQYSKHVDELDGIAFDYVVTLCDYADRSKMVQHGVRLQNSSTLTQMQPEGLVR